MEKDPVSVMDVQNANNIKSKSLTRLLTIVTAILVICTGLAISFIPYAIKIKKNLESRVDTPVDKIIRSIINESLDVVLPTRFIINDDFILPPSNQMQRGTCWMFATLFLLESQYREYGIRKGFLNKDEYVLFSKQAYGSYILQECRRDHSSGVCKHGGPAQNSTDDHLIPTLYYLTKAFPKLTKSILPEAVCPYIPTDSSETDYLCDGMWEAIETNPIQFKIKSMETARDVRSTKRLLVKSQRPLGLSFPFADFYYYAPCDDQASNYSNTDLCSAEKSVDCPKGYKSKKCAKIDIEMRNSADGTFQSIVFTDCNCIQGDENTVFINATSKPNLDNAFHYNCNNIGQCPSGSEKPPESSECKNMETRREIYGGQFEIENSCFYDLKSSASREGGAIHAINTKIELENCRFKSCSSDKEGGAVYVSFSISECQFEIEKCTFEDCSSGAQGGALFFENKFASKSSIKECKFINNKAASHGGAVYYSPCANSKLSKCFFVNNTCTGSNNVYGSSIYILVKNLNTMNKMTKLRIKDDEETNKVIVEGNRIRSEPAEGIQQMYINLKKTGNLQLGDNSFSFNGAKETPKNSKYIDVKTDEGAQLEVTGDICVDLNNASLINGINTNIEYDCHKADSENDENNTGGKNKNKNNVGMIVGIVVACVVVIAIVVVVVILVKRKKDQNKYISDIGDGDVADGSTGPITNNDPEMAT